MKHRGWRWKKADRPLICFCVNGWKSLLWILRHLAQLSSTCPKQGHFPDSFQTQVELLIYWQFLQDIQVMLSLFYFQLLIYIVSAVKTISSFPWMPFMYIHCVTSYCCPSPSCPFLGHLWSKLIQLKYLILDRTDIVWGTAAVISRDCGHPYMLFFSVPDTAPSRISGLLAVLTNACSVWRHDHRIVSQLLAEKTNGSTNSGRQFLLFTWAQFSKKPAPL